jgi:hypothetical protein
MRPALRAELSRFPFFYEQKADPNEVRGIFSVLTITRLRF